MSEDLELVTVSMAKVYADQGRVEKAADIYRRLLARSPERRDILEALEALPGEKTVRVPDGDSPAVGAATKNHSGELPGLLGEWVRWLIRYDHIRRLKKKALSGKDL
ncbi:MAG: tetratricopeptide repeat protein [Thermodesulfobacteriota bacterium]